MYQLYLDLAELDEVLAGRWLWSTRRPAPCWFRRADHLGAAGVPLEVAVRAVVEDRTGCVPRGPIRLLTNLRTWGYVMNPVSFFYCFEADGRTLQTIVAEVHNTPWGERHLYVLPVDECVRRGPWLCWRFHKQFHVSPFLAMEHDYEWRFTVPDERLGVHMRVTDEGGVRVLDVDLQMRARPIAGGPLARVLLRTPFVTGKVVAAIYWQALRLWWKGVAFHEHPRRRGPVRAKDVPQEGGRA